MTPLIRRHTAIAIPMEAAPVAVDTELLDDLRFFLMAWAAGFVFFGTLFA